LISTSEFRNGAKIELDGQPFVIIEFQHVKPGKGGAFVRTKLKSLLSGSVLEKTFRAGEKLPVPDVEEKEMQFLYAQGSDYHFMDSRSYEQLAFARDQLGDATDFLKDNMSVTVQLFRGKPISVLPPTFVDLRIVTTDPGIRGDTATGGTKPAVVETGATIKVPLYLEEGDVIRIDTRTHAFVERAK
jgi:elongation factor P